ncbi:alpha/beta fold hydrolase [Nakamurella sp. YIM 132087]|uniref:Alpha/beta fold hydrolase n=1 Tax=Nakamurella alba TaxID=2665158 RepID=A0A7K1FQ01_9ACTN|nr:alpha/beta fold hydrolase [Nakamurella alba]MTD16228.1 alpha/beta fold hydrolase [Nakamurella alba]
MVDHVTTTPHPVGWSSEGSGPALVLLHGLGGDRNFWAAEMSSLAQRFRVIAPDLRGSGGTPSGPDGHRIADLADDVAAILDDIAVETAHVVGFSMGGLVAQAFAVRHPGRLRRLVLASTYAVMNPQSRMFLDAVRDVVVSTGSMRAVYPLVCPWLFSLEFQADPANAAWFETPADDGESPSGWLAQYAAQREFDGTPDLAGISAPTLVLHGAADALVAGSDALALVEGIPGAGLRAFAGAGHLINLELPGEFLGEVGDFLTTRR